LDFAKLSFVDRKFFSGNSRYNAGFRTQDYKISYGATVSDVQTLEFDRKPYVISYRDQNGEMNKLRRVPPPKLHEALPADKVAITRGRSEDFAEGDIVTVKHINTRHPNVLQVTNKDGNTSFLSHLDIRLEERVALRAGIDPRDEPEANAYLLWP